jgi:hypothetical protein
VHRAWPKGEISRLAKRADRETDFIKAKNQTIQKFMRHGLDEKAIKKAMTVPFIDYAAQRGKDPEKQKSFWWSIPYHPVIYRSGIRRILNRDS